MGVRQRTPFSVDASYRLEDRDDRPKPQDHNLNEERNKLHLIIFTGSNISVIMSVLKVSSAQEF